MMLTAASWAAVALYLAPIAFVLWARSSRGRPLWAIALDLPIAVSADLLLVLALTRFLRLEAATLVSRGVWVALAAAWVVRLKVRRVAMPRWPRALDARAIALACTGAGAATWLSMLLSRPYSIWDRKWHTPLVSSLRGQTIPFSNVFNPAEVLHYHFAGDVHAAMMQTLTGGLVHSSFALSLGHDVLFGLIGLALALFLAGLGARSLALVAAVVLAVLLDGPLTLLRDIGPRAVEGYSILNYITMSFRPHDALAGLYYVGFFGSIAARALARPARPSDTVPALLLATAGLAVSDEASIGLLGLALGLTWLFFPDAIHPRRVTGALVLGGLLVALVGPNLAFAASIAPGAQQHAIAIVPWRSPGCYTKTLPLTTFEGWRMLLFDTGPTLLAWLGCVLAWAANRRRAAAPMLVATLLLALSLVMLTRIEVNESALESHRFMTGAMFIVPLAGVMLLLARQGVLTRRALALRLVGGALLVVGAGLGAASTTHWIADLAPRKAHRHSHYFTKEDLYALDCRRDFGATLGEATAPAYLSKSLWYAYAGCRPVFAPGVHGGNPWSLTIGNPAFDKAALKALDARDKTATLSLACQRGATAKVDAVCAFAERHGLCTPHDARWTRCEMTPAQRRDALR